MARLALATFSPPPHVPGYFWKRKFFFSVFKKYVSLRSVFESFWPSIWKQHSITYGACVMLEVYDVWHHRIGKPPFSSVHTQTKSRRFQKSLLWRAFLKRSAFSDRFHWIRVDGRPKSKEKNISFETKTDTSGQGGALSCIMLEAKAWLTVEMMITNLSCPWNSSTDPTFTSPNPKRSSKRRSFSTYESNGATKTKIVISLSNN